MSMAMGFDDIIIGAPYGGNNSPGESYVVLGIQGFDARVKLSTLNGSNGFIVSGVSFSGNSVSSAGDVNGDGFADLILGLNVPISTVNMMLARAM
jgi:hypothetical protein